MTGRGLVSVEVAEGDRVRWKERGTWLRQIGEGDAGRVRPARVSRADAKTL